MERERTAWRYPLRCSPSLVHSESPHRKRGNNKSTEKTRLYPTTDRREGTPPGPKIASSCNAFVLRRCQILLASSRRTAPGNTANLPRRPDRNATAGLIKLGWLQEGSSRPHPSANHIHRGRRCHDCKTLLHQSARF